MSNSSNISECSWQIIFSHIVKTKIPKFQDTWTQFFIAISISSAISNPHIKSLICEIKRRSQRLIINYPCIWTVDKAMLQINNSFIWNYIRIFCWITLKGTLYSIKLKIVMIISWDDMVLDWVIEVVAVLKKLKGSLWIT